MFWEKMRKPRIHFLPFAYISFWWIFSAKRWLLLRFFFSLSLSAELDDLHKIGYKLKALHVQTRPPKKKGEEKASRIWKKMKCRHLNSFVRFHFTVEFTKIHFKLYRMFLCTSATVFPFSQCSNTLLMLLLAPHRTESRSAAKEERILSFGVLWPTICLLRS